MRRLDEWLATLTPGAMFAWMCAALLVVLAVAVTLALTLP